MVALNELTLSESDNGYENGDKYWKAQGQSAREPWCADFVSYCAARAGLVQDGSYPATRNEICNVVSLRNWYANHPSRGSVFLNDGTYIPRVGDIAIRIVGDEAQHAAIVIGVKKAKGVISVTTIAGNVGNRVSRDHSAYNKTGVKGWTQYISINMKNRTPFLINLHKAKISGITGKMYTGYPHTQNPTVCVGGKRVSRFALKYKNNTKRGNATMTLHPTAGLVADNVPRTTTRMFAINGIPMLRLYNPKTGEHFYTASNNEKATLVAKHGWKYEGVAWYGC